MAATINAQATTGLITTSDGSGIVKLQSNGVTTNSLGWINFAAASSGINSSYNISSITRVSSSVYTINFATALSYSSYSAVAASTGLNVSYPYMVTTIFSNTNGYVAPTTTAFTVCTVGWNGAAAGSSGDPTMVTATVFGN